MKRREAVGRMLGIAALSALPRPLFPYEWGKARLESRPTVPKQKAVVGLSPLGLETGRDGLLLVPKSYSPDKPSPLVLALHGATGTAARAVERLRDAAEERGFIVLGADSREGTWDAIRAGFGPDVRFIDRALQYAFDSCVVDPERIAVQGFSDGASYALGLALPNGDLFRRAMAFSPGMIPATETPDHGKPQLFVSHGTKDPILNIDRSSRVLVRGLKKDGYDVTYVEFDGIHTVPPEILKRAMEWWLA
jgi:phospholipase/carboxylesterase